MTALLEVLALHAADAERAEAGGADRIMLTTPGGLSPEPAVVSQVRRATTVTLRVMLRLREGFSTDGGELVRLQGLLASYRAVGVEGMVVGFLNGHTEIDGAVLQALVGDVGGWTFDRAVDSCISTDRAWRELRQLPGLDSVHTAGSARGVSDGLDDLVQRARADDFARDVMMAAGGLLPEHVPWLVRAGIRAFHIDTAARPLGSQKAYVDADLVGAWRSVIDDAVDRSAR